MLLFLNIIIMASFKFVISKYQKQDGTHSVDLRITIARKHKDIPTGYCIKPKDWNPANGRVKPSNKNFTEINDSLEVKRLNAERTYAKLDKNTMPPTLQQVVKGLNTPHDFYEVAKLKIAMHREAGQIGTADKVTTQVGIIRAFAPDLKLEQVTPELIIAFKNHLKNTKNRIGKKYAVNTITGILSSFRAIYNYAGIKTSDIDPFRVAKVGTYRASGGVPLAESEIDKIWNYIPSGKWEKLARSTFLFSYYALGMRSADVLKIRWDNVGDDGYITYSPGKTKTTTGKVLYVPLNSWLLKIIEGQERTHDTIFGIITATSDDPKELDRQIGNAQTEINSNLKKIAARVGIDKPIKFKLARTTLADIANKKTGRNIYGIQQSLGHSRIATTEIYLGDDKTAVDEVAKAVYG